MMPLTLIIRWFLLVAVVTAGIFPTDQTVQSIVSQRSADDSGAAIIVGIIDHGQTKIFKAGSTGTSRPLDVHTTFQIGSITKTFTGTMLAALVQAKIVSPDDPVSTLLGGRPVPSKDGKQITLLDLATQTSGLPRLHTNLKFTDPADPYADYAVDDLYAFLAGYTLPRDPGSQYEYSNLAFGLLGHALAMQQKTSYANLLVRLITQPLGMTETMAAVPVNDPSFAVGHDVNGTVIPAWHLGALAGAGAIASSMSDMLKYLRANMGIGRLAGVTEFAQQMHRGLLGFAWMHGVKTGIIWHNGATAGYTSFIGMTKDRSRGVVILSNSGLPPDDIGVHLLVPSIPLTAYPNMQLAPAHLDALTGAYSLAPAAVLTITRRGDQLWAQLTGQGANRLYASAADHFYLRVVDAQISFNRDSSGKVTSLTLHQGGHDIPAGKQ